jgi:hypothetical protein
MLIDPSGKAHLLQAQCGDEDAGEIVHLGGGQQTQ